MIPKRIILTGFMGTGKTTVGRALAQRLGYPFWDTDAWVEEQAGKSISQIFAEEGEGAFRLWESQAIDQALSEPRGVVALGGGAICCRENFRKLRKGGALVLLTATVPTILRRVGEEKNRPLLQGESPEQQVGELLKKRARDYGRISLKVPTDRKSPASLAEEILQALTLEGAALPVHLGEKSYPIYFHQDSRRYIKYLINRHCPSERAVLLSNPTVFKLHGKALLGALKSDVKIHPLLILDGERHKNLATLAKIYRGLAEAKVDRKTPLIALGGGVIGDMGGFAAASFLRGIPYIQIPTTLLAQVDSSIGGKTGIDLPQGKNLVGAFYQPKFVLIDENFLVTLPERQLKCGLAEVIKYAAIFDASLFRDLERTIGEILRRKGAGLMPIVRRCCEWKAKVVGKDEFDTKGLRAKLNFGHTLGHAVEALTSYRKYTHGEAISMGMVFAAQKSVLRTGLKARELERLRALLAAAGLPVVLPPLSKSALRKALLQDKKRVSQDIHFVYLERIGKSVVIPTPLEKIL